MFTLQQTNMLFWFSDSVKTLFIGHFVAEFDINPVEMLVPTGCSFQQGCLSSFSFLCPEQPLTVHIMTFTLCYGVSMDGPQRDWMVMDSNNLLDRQLVNIRKKIIFILYVFTIFTLFV